MLPRPGGFYNDIAADALSSAYPGPRPNKHKVHFLPIDKISVSVTMLVVEVMGLFL